jgi:hypothetical protein
MGDRHQQARAITCRIVRLAKGSSRVFACVAWLRPRCARLTPLTSPRSSPVLGKYVMAREVHGRSRTTGSTQRKDQAMNTMSDHTLDLACVKTW